MKAILVALAVLGTVAAVAGMVRGGGKVPAPPAPAADDVLGRLSSAPVIDELRSPRPDRFRWAVVAGGDAAAALPVLDRLGAAQGWVPVFVGAQDDWPDFASGEQEPQAVLDAANAIDAAHFLAARADESAAGGIDDPALLGDWVEDPQARRALGVEPYSVWRDVRTDRPQARLYIALVPAKEAWQAPAFLQNGGWNEVPSPAEQVAVLHYWHERHGARLRTFSSDVMEFEVARPPTGHDATLALAREHFGFSSDIVFQGVEALRPLASSLDGKRNWYFWWD